jgi:hypothetical protein
VSSDWLDLVDWMSRTFEWSGLATAWFTPSSLSTPCDAIGLVIERHLSVRQVHVRDVRSSVLDQFSLFDRPRARGGGSG